jgi:hypothetical protein
LGRGGRNGWSGFETEDRELRADHLAQVAVHTFAALDHLRRVVALAVEFLGHAQNVPRAILHAKSATLAAVGDDENLAVRRRDSIGIQGFSPISHEASFSLA